MPLVKVGGGVTDIRGSIAGNTFSRTRSGMVLKTRTVPTNTRSSSQSKSRTLFSYLNKAWKDILTDTERTAWQSYANSVGSQNKLGEKIHLTGQLSFIRSNQARITADLPIAGPPGVQLLAEKEPTLTFTFSPSGQQPSAIPVLVRDLLHTGSFWLYIPSSAGYWTRYLYRRTGNAATQYGSPSIYSLNQTFFGIVRPGKIQDYARAFAVSGAWGDVESFGWKLRMTTTLNKWIDFKIPSGHNRIHLIAYTAAASQGTLAFSLGSTQGSTDLDSELDLTSYSLNQTPTGIRDIVLATNADTPGEKYLRIKNSNGVQTIISGIHSFDTAGTASPSELLSGLVLGNDMPDWCIGTIAYLPTYNAITENTVYEILKESSFEITIAWKPAAELFEKWSSTGALHQGAGNASLYHVLASTLSVGGIVIGLMSDSVTIPRGTVYENASMTIHTIGKGDYNEDFDITDPVDCMQIDWTANITAAGISFDSTITWSADANVSDLYAPRVGTPDSKTGIATINGIDYPYSADDIDNYSVNNATQVAIVQNQTPCVITAAMLGPSQYIYEHGVAPTTNCYCRVNLASLTGGASPPLGTVWSGLGSTLAITTIANVASITFDTSLSWSHETGAGLIVHQGKPRSKTTKYYPGPWRFAGLIAGSVTTPPASPAFINLPFPIAAGQKCWLKFELTRSSGRLSNPFQIPQLVT